MQQYEFLGVFLRDPWHGGQLSGILVGRLGGQFLCLLGNPAEGLGRVNWLEVYQ